MPPRFYVVTETQSRYALLGAFGRQLASAAQRCGLTVNPDAGGAASWTKPGAAAFLFFNHVASLEGAYGWAGEPERWSGGAGRGRALIQWCVDHPLTIDAPWLDRLSRDPGFRLLTVTTDDTHLLSLRFPNLRHGTVTHGVDESALCDASSIASSHRDGRDIDVLIAASIPSQKDLDTWRGQIPAALHDCCDDVIALRLAHPSMSFGQALCLALPAGIHTNDHWLLMQKVFAYTAASVGRTRRIAAAKAMQGLNTVLIGTEAWKELATGTLKYAGQVAYDELPSWLMRAKVCLALSPPQFATGFSERLLLSMAAGCGTVAEARVAIGREFGATPAIQQYSAQRPEMARVIVGKLLDNAEQRAAMGAAGREIIATGHLWGHRVGPVLDIAGLLDQVRAEQGGRAAA